MPLFTLTRRSGYSVEIEEDSGSGPLPASTPTAPLTYTASSLAGRECVELGVPLLWESAGALITPRGEGVHTGWRRRGVSPAVDNAPVNPCRAMARRKSTVPRHGEGTASRRPLRSATVSRSLSSRTRMACRSSIQVKPINRVCWPAPVHKRRDIPTLPEQRIEAVLEVLSRQVRSRHVLQGLERDVVRSELVAEPSEIGRDTRRRRNGTAGEPELMYLLGRPMLGRIWDCHRYRLGVFSTIAHECLSFRYEDLRLVFQNSEICQEPTPEAPELGYRPGGAETARQPEDQ